jgi:hypothetical protein
MRFLVLFSSFSPVSLFIPPPSLFSLPSSLSLTFYRYKFCFNLICSLMPAQKLCPAMLRFTRRAFNHSARLSKRNNQPMDPAHRQHPVTDHRPSSAQQLNTTPFSSPAPLPLGNRQQQLEQERLIKETNQRLQRSSAIHPDVEKEPIKEEFEGDVNPKTGEVHGPKGPEPTRFGDWERKGQFR